MLDALQLLTVDGRLLFATRFVRLFAYGALSVVLVLYLVGLGLKESATGVLLTATLLGDTLVSLYLTTRADRFGRRRILIVGASLMAAAGLAFAFTHQFWLLVVAGTIGVISPSGHEVGPFLPIEQAALSQVVPAASTNGRVRLVHPRRIDRHGAGLARGGTAHRISSAHMDTRRQLSRGRRGVRVHWRGALWVIPEGV